MVIGERLVRGGTKKEVGIGGQPRDKGVVGGTNWGVVQMPHPIGWHGNNGGTGGDRK